LRRTFFIFTLHHITLQENLIRPHLGKREYCFTVLIITFREAIPGMATRPLIIAVLIIVKCQRLTGEELLECVPVRCTV
jgi:hypothetical protein